MKRIVLDAGHGGKDPGAVGNGLSEKNITLALVKETVTYLQMNYKATVFQTRNVDGTITLAERSSFANTNKADVFISFHINAHSSDLANGFESFIHPNAGSTTKELQKALHSKIVKLWKDAGRGDRGAKEANFHVLRETKMPAVLLEFGFVSNSKDAQLLKDYNFIKKNAAAVADALAEFLGLEKLKTFDKPKSIYRVIVNGKQTGAFAEQDNILRSVSESLKSGAEKVYIEKV
jgi:N-acetylmuramoyl-L-alanine amidase